MSAASVRQSTPDLRHVSLQPSVLYFGTPVCLISTVNPDGSANLAPISSCWYLGYTVVLGIGADGQTLPNLIRERECVINLPSAGQLEAVEALAPLTGRNPVPDDRRDSYRYEPRKFESAGLSPITSDTVAAPRVAECPVQLEARVSGLHEPKEGGFTIVETQVQRVHVEQALAVPNSQHIDITQWHPLMYVFRHYFELGTDLGRNFRADQ